MVASSANELYERLTYLAPVSVSAPLIIQTARLAPTDPVSAVTTPGDEKIPLPCVRRWDVRLANQWSKTLLREQKNERTVNKTDTGPPTRCTLQMRMIKTLINIP